MGSFVIVLLAGFPVVNPRFLVLYKIEINSSLVRGRNKPTLSTMIDHDNGYGPRHLGTGRKVGK